MDAGELVSRFRKACTIATFLASRESTCLAHKIGVDLSDLASFKYLLPDEVVFGYEDTPSDTVFGSVPHQVLAFKFNDKRDRKKQQTSAQTIKLINDRVQRFERALDQFTARRGSLRDLQEFAKPYMPSADPFADQFSAKEDGDESIGDRVLVGDELFDEVCSILNTVVSQVNGPGRPAQFRDTPPQLAPYLSVDKLWAHQSQGLEHLLASTQNHLVISTPTASGKSLIFHTIVKYYLTEFEESTALFIYPTKALAQDQLRAFSYERAHTFDGDTDFKLRDQIQKNARVLFINPDILHATILPNWQHFAHFLGNLRCVVMDELHYYGGVFGANVAMVLRRLRRMCYQLGAEDCQFIGCSATVSEPVQLMSTLTGLNTESILELNSENDGSPSGPKRFVFATTGYLTPEDPLSGRQHPMCDAAPLLVRMVKHNMRVIAFCRYRRDCELMLRRVYDIDPSLRSVVKGYRGGYNQEDRREIESLMFNDKLKGIVSTTALEVGIDIGSLDAAIIVGFPHSISGFRQQVGRVGRRQKESLVVYIADGSVVDQTYAANPNKVLNEPLSQMPIILHDSIVRSHLQAAAYEQALDKDEDLQFFPPVDDISPARLEELDNNCLGYGFKPSINLRKAEDEKEDTVVIDSATNKILERVEYDRVGFTLYEGAIFIHQGKAYLVTFLEQDLKYAKVQRTHVKWITRQRDYTDVDPLACKTTKYLTGDSHEASSAALGQGTIKVTTKVFGYFKFNENNQPIDAVDVNIPPLISFKTGVWINLSTKILNILKSRDHHIAASIHAAEHVIITVLPMYVSMAPGDIATECKAPEKEILAKRQTMRIRPARLIFYEKYGGSLGNGILHSAYGQFNEILDRSSKALEDCPCELGCGACVGSGSCVEHNAVLSKNGAKVILRLLLSRTVEDIPVGPDSNMPEQLVHTVVPIGVQDHSLQPYTEVGQEPVEEVKKEEVKKEDIKKEEVNKEDVKKEDVKREVKEEVKKV